MSNIIPQQLCIYYSYPSSVNGTYNIDAAAAVFAAYDQVVLGSGLEGSHPDHDNTVAIINHPLTVNTEFFGYVDSTLDLSVIQDKIDAWNTMGVKGIFADRFGYDFGLDREKQRQIVWSIHNAGDNKLKAFVNAFNPDDVFSPDVNTNNPNGLTTRLEKKDIYLAESFAVINGNYDDNDLDNNGIKDWQDKATKMVHYRNIYGTKMAAIATTANADFDQSKADYSYFAAVLNRLNSWGWGEQYYSASSAQLPYRNRKEFYGTKFDGIVKNINGVYERRTNVGINVNTINHTVDTLLDI